MLGRTVAIFVACAVHAVQLCEEKGRLLAADIVADERHELRVTGGSRGHVLIRLYDAVGDGVPVAEGAQGGVGPLFPDAAEATP